MYRRLYVHRGGSLLEKSSGYSVMLLISVDVFWILANEAISGARRFARLDCMVILVRRVAMYALNGLQVILLTN